MLSWFGLDGADKGKKPEGGASLPAPKTFSESIARSALPPPPPPSSSSSSSAGGGGGGGGGGGNQAFHFDPSGLERAAKAARELDASKNAHSAFEVVKMQEQTEQMRLQTQISQYETQAKSLDLQRAAKMEEERRRTLETETSHMIHRAQEQDKLARKRMEDEINAQRQLQLEMMRRQEESLQKQEGIKRATVEYEMKLKRDLELEKVKAETEGRILFERENRDLHLEELRLKAAEARDTALQSIRAAGEVIGNGISDFVRDGDKMMASVAGLSLLALGVYSARTSTGVIGRVIEARIGKPSLVRDTSRRTPLTWLRHPIKSAADLVRSFSTKGDALESIVLPQNVEQRLRTVAWSTIHARQNRAPYRNIMLHGPPGTGKTMFAKSLARSSNMDYAILTGGDVTPLGRNAVTEIHRLFDWANTSRRGLLLFVDEADAFLRKRSETSMSEDMRNALNAFLYRTGEANKRFMLVLASNQPEQLDWAINDRVDELVGFPLPGPEERLRIVKQYFDQYIRKHSESTGAKPIEVEGIDDAVLQSVADRTEGFSGRELSKLAIAWQATAYGSSANAKLTRAVLDSVTNAYVIQHKQREHWTNKAI